MAGGDTTRRLPAHARPAPADPAPVLRETPLPPPPLPGAQSLQAALILSLFAYQSLQVSDSFGGWLATPIWLLPYVLIPGLAALAGQLAMRRLQAIGLARFLLWLAVRLGAALLVAIIVAALVIGPLVSIRSLRAYVTDPELWTYFLNLLFWPQFSLPGVFIFNNVPVIVNDIFWALPAIPVAVAGLCTTAIRPGRAATALIALLALAGGAALALQLLGVGASAVGAAAIVKPLGVVVGFLLGALGEVWRRAVPASLAGTGVAIGLLLAIAFFNQRAWGNSAAFNALVAVPASYVVISLAARPLPAPGFGQRYLCGLLLLGFPVQQASIALGSVRQGFVVNLAISLPVTLLLAALSWHLVEARLAARVGGAALGADIDGWAPAGSGRPLSLARVRRQLVSNLPMIAVWTLFFLLAIGVMAMIIFASQPDRGGI